MYKGIPSLVEINVIKILEIWNLLMTYSEVFHQLILLLSYFLLCKIKNNQMEAFNCFCLFFHLVVFYYP